MTGNRYFCIRLDTPPTHIIGPGHALINGKNYVIEPTEIDTTDIGTIYLLGFQESNIAEIVQQKDTDQVRFAELDATPQLIGFWESGQVMWFLHRTVPDGDLQLDSIIPKKAKNILEYRKGKTDVSE